MDDLPDACISHILNALNSTDVRSASRCCHRFHALVRDQPDLFHDILLDFSREAHFLQHGEISKAQHRASTPGAAYTRQPHLRSSVQPVRKALLFSWLQRHAPYITCLTLLNSARPAMPFENFCHRLTWHDLQIDDLAELFNLLPHLTQLHLSMCNDILRNFSCFKSLNRPEALVALSLKGLSIDMRVADPSAIGHLLGLQHLTLVMDPPSTEGLRALPDTWASLTQLRNLELRGHLHFKKLPSWITRMTLLESLSIEMSDLRSMRRHLSSLPSLTHLSLANNDMAESESGMMYDEWFPAVGAVGHLTGLRCLNLQGCGMATVPEAMSELVSLTLLDLSDNPLGQVEDHCTDYMARRGLFRDKKIINNGLSHLLGCANLRDLRLRNCQLTFLPPTLTQMTTLKRLDVSCNDELEGLQKIMEQLVLEPMLHGMGIMKTCQGNP